MERVFLSMSFHPEDQALVAAASAIIESQDLRVMTGKHLAGAGLSAEIKRRIDDCALVAICSRRDPVPGGIFTVSSWVRDELSYALAKQKPLLALVEDGVDLGRDDERARARSIRSQRRTRRVCQAGAQLGAVATDSGLSTTRGDRTRGGSGGTDQEAGAASGVLQHPQWDVHAVDHGSTRYLTIDATSKPGDARTVLDSVASFVQTLTSRQK